MKPPRNLDIGLLRTFAAIADQGGFRLEVVIPANSPESSGMQRTVRLNSGVSDAGTTNCALAELIAIIGPPHRNA